MSANTQYYVYVDVLVIVPKRLKVHAINSLDAQLLAEAQAGVVTVHDVLHHTEVDDEDNFDDEVW